MSRVNESALESRVINWAEFRNAMIRGSENYLAVQDPSSVRTGTVVEGEKAKQNSASEITSDVNVEYKITKDGRYRLKGFRHNQYEGAIEGALVETGAGVLYVRDFNKWKEFFKSPKKLNDSLKKISNDTIR